MQVRLRCPANMAHIRQSGLDFLVEVFKPFLVFPLRSEAAGQGIHSAAALALRGNAARVRSM